jgi:hypothetical protein
MIESGLSLNPNMKAFHSERKDNEAYQHFVPDGVSGGGDGTYRSDGLGTIMSGLLGNSIVLGGMDT